MARPWRAGGDGRGISVPPLPWHEAQKMQESEEAEARRPVVVEVHVSGGGYEEDAAGRLYGQPDRYYFACSCGACGPLRRIRDIARHDGTLHELWHEQNPAK